MRRALRPLGRRRAGLSRQTGDQHASSFRHDTRVQFGVRVIRRAGHGSVLFPQRAPQAFSTQELKQYGLDAESTQCAVELQKQGYAIRVLTEEKAAKYQAGDTDNQWVMLAILAGVIVIAVAVV